LDQTFFGFKPADRILLHKVLFDLIWAGNGRWDWQTIYNMPIFLRNFWIDNLNEKNQPKTATKSKTEIATPPANLKL
jgi:hypothetical protein